jgi:hypothetical protein
MPKLGNVKGAKTVKNGLDLRLQHFVRARQATVYKIDTLIRDQEVGGSNPLAPTILFKELEHLGVSHLVSATCSSEDLQQNRGVPKKLRCNHRLKNTHSRSEASKT